MEKSKRISIKEASDILDLNEKTLRRLLRHEKIPIGIADRDGGNYTYYIWEEKLEAYLNRNTRAGEAY